MEKINYQTIFRKCKEASVKAHYHHLQTTSHAEHEALDKFYTKLNDLADDFVESCLRYDPSAINIPEVLQISQVPIRDYLDELCVYFQGQIMLCTDNLAIQDHLIAIDQLIMSTMYKLRQS